MLAKIDWDNVVPAGAFILGAIFATFAVLRVVRALSLIFSDDLRERRRRRDVEEEHPDRHGD